MEGRAARGERPTGGGVAAELRDGPAGDDPVPEVPGVGAADRQWADGVDVQGDDATDQGAGAALGRGQRRERHGAGGPGTKRRLAGLLGGPTLPRRLTPERFATPRAGACEIDLALPRSSATMHLTCVPGTST